MIVVSAFAIVWGAVALVGGLRCYFDSEHAGFFRHPAVGIVAMTFPAAMMALATAVGGDVAGFLFPLAVATIMSGPLLAYHLVGAFARAFSPVSDTEPEPTDPLLRAKAAEDRADTVIAVERYLRLLEAEPSNKEARARLADLLARTGRIEWSKDVVEKGMSLAEAGPEARAEWRALRLKWAEGKGVEAPSAEAPRLRGLEDSPTPRLDMHAEARSTADDSAVPFDEGEEEEGVDAAGEDDDDRPIPFP